MTKPAAIDRPTDAKAGFSTMCRRDDHDMCTMAGARCTCECHGAARRFLAANGNRKAASSSAAAVGAVRPVQNPEPTPPIRGVTPAGARAKPGDPVFELVKADPPEPPRKKTVAEFVRPLLEEILVAGDHDWYRIVVFPSPNRANFVLAKLRKAFSSTEWEWRGVKIAEVGQSAIYVRWAGKDGGRALEP